MKAFKFLCGLCLLPFCWAVTLTLAAVIRSLRASPDGLSAAAWALVAGFMLWMLIYVWLPRPVRAYVLAHELTHALWATLMGARVKKLKVAAQGGSVSLTKSNFLIALAPYFFPFYTVLAVAAYYLLSLFFRVEGAYLWWMGLVGFTWGFHLTFTGATLLRNQTDIHDQGYLFSYAVIYFANLFGICLWVVMVSPVTAHDSLVIFARNSREACTNLWAGLTAAYAWASGQEWGRLIRPAH